MRNWINWRIIRQFLLSVRPQLAVYAGMVILFGGVYILARQPLDFFFYSVQLSLFLFGLYLAVQFVRYVRRDAFIRRLTKAELKELEEMPASPDPADRLYEEKIASLIRELRENEKRQREREADQLDYFTLWLHQIKTPIAAISLLTQRSSEKAETSANASKQISQELIRLEDYTHMALNYIKLEESEAGLELAEADVDSIIKKALKKYAILFIYKGIRLEYEPVNMQVLTDGKWLEVVLEQLLSNSLKYTPAGTITISKDPDNAETLLIRDTGVGILPEDLPKIFDKGYSGLNGRLHEKSTGLGLFLCQKICRRLGHRIAIRSEPGEGTAVSLDLSREKLSVFD